MFTPERPFASYHLWSLIAPAMGQQNCHCQMRRGFMKARQHEPIVKILSSKVTSSQWIGILAQQGVYEFHQNKHLLKKKDGVERVTKILNLNNYTYIVRQRVVEILKNYHDYPLLWGKRILQLTRGDEGFPKPIIIEQDLYSFRLYAAMDCVLTNPSGNLHILDFKTGKSAFDVRQALVYLLAARYLYPKKEVVASFYNLESRKKSDTIIVTENELNSVELKLSQIAQKHQQDIQKYHEKNSNFSQIFPPNPGNHCKFCPFNSICEFSAS